MNRIDFSNLGGLPVTQATLAFLQTSYLYAFSGIANLCGDKTILTGVEVTAGNVSSGWISYANELIPFLGGPLGDDVVITETGVARTFEDGNDHDVYFTKIAQCGAVGTFAFTDLIRLQSLVNIWRPGDIKERYCDASYIAANFDVNGYGINAEKGWRILSKAIPATAGKVMVNYDPADVDFDTVGKNGGEKKHTLTIQEMPAHNHSLSLFKDEIRHNGTVDISANGGAALNKNTGNAGGGQAHNNLQPYFVILKLIKL